jgi:hypothetical protein
MEGHFEDHRNFGPSSLESRNVAGALMITKAERTIICTLKTYPDFESYLTAVKNYVKSRK